MAIVTAPEDQRKRIWATHATWLLIPSRSFLLLAVLSISLRPGKEFRHRRTHPRQISFEHWKLALGIPTLPPTAPSSTPRSR